MRSIVLLILFYSVAAFASEPSEGEKFLEKQPKNIVASLKRDKLVIFSKPGTDPGSTARFIHALAIFDQSADTTIRMLIQTSKQADYLPVLQKSTTIKQFTDGNEDEHQLTVFIFHVVYYVRHRWDLEKRKLWWHLDPEMPNDLKTVEGGWDIYPLDDKHSVGAYRTHIDVGSSIPNFVQEYLTRRDLPKALENQRLWVNSGGTFRFKK
jgi:hypothetical protein